MKHKGFYLSVLAGLLCVLLLVFGGKIRMLLSPAPVPEAVFRTSGRSIQHLNEGAWEPFQMIGVNIGTGYPGLFPNEMGIPEETYYRWFTLIGEMNANTIRVYKLQSPAFYAAFARYNATHTQPLYLVQGVDFPEQMVYSAENLLEPEGHTELFRDTRDVVDALHGDLMQYDSGSDQMHIYRNDVSGYVLGYLLGIEWDETFVEYTCRINERLNGFSGTYLTCGADANPFEMFLAMWGNDLLTYETDSYGTQPLISFCNWPDTDPFRNEIQKEKPGNWQKKSETPVDVEHVHPTDQMLSGMFASYNVYPYFPSFLQYGHYISYTDETGTHNPYRNYLMNLAQYHTCPVIISEYGIPSSRSRAYGEVWRDISHGGLSEQEQGAAVAMLFDDIRKAGCAGSIVFTWQDEWYKTIWNESLISEPDRRAFWSNAQCAEQFFGLMAFEPGATGFTCYPDGSLDDWDGIEPVITQEETTLKFRSDEKYVYFLAEGLDYRPGNNRVCLALDLTPKSGRSSIGSVELEREADFVIQIDPSGESGLYVDETYDVLPYSALGKYPDATMEGLQAVVKNDLGSRLRLKESPEFVLVSRADGNIYTRLASRWLINPVGRLVEGNTNPESPEYASRADFCFAGDAVEIRIPWQLLNFRDPSTCTIVDDLQENHLQIRPLRIHQLYAAVYFDDADVPVPFGQVALSEWDQPVFHERLKQSYFILRDAFKAVK